MLLFESLKIEQSRKHCRYQTMIDCEMSGRDKLLMNTDSELPKEVLMHKDVCMYFSFHSFHQLLDNETNK